MKIYVRTTKKIDRVDVADGVTAAEFAATHGGTDVWPADANEPLPADAELPNAVVDGSHVFVGTCKTVAATVRYGGTSKQETFPPAAAVQAVFAWATGKKGFDLTAAEAAKHTLVSADGQTILERSDHIGQFATDCAVTIDLVPKDRFQG